MKYLVVGLLMVIASPLYSQTQSPLLGIWDTGQENTHVEIFDEEGMLTGKIISSDNDKVKIGLVMLKDLEEKDGYWEGKIYSLRRKDWFDAEIRPNGNKLDLEVSTGFFSKSIKWKKSS
jgi:uncharacterized protein (DUF2147 family)